MRGTTVAKRVQKCFVVFTALQEFKSVLLYLPPYHLQAIFQHLLHLSQCIHTQEKDPPGNGPSAAWPASPSPRSLVAGGSIPRSSSCQRQAGHRPEAVEEQGLMQPCQAPQGTARLPPGELGTPPTPQPLRFSPKPATSLPGPTSPRRCPSLARSGGEARLGLRTCRGGCGARRGRGPAPRRCSMRRARPGCSPRTRPARSGSRAGGAAARTPAPPSSPGSAPRRRRPPAPARRAATTPPWRLRVAVARQPSLGLAGAALLGSKVTACFRWRQRPNTSIKVSALATVDPASPLPWQRRRWARADNGGSELPPSPLGRHGLELSPAGQPARSEGGAGQAPRVRREGSRWGGRLTSASAEETQGDGASRAVRPPPRPAPSLRGELRRAGRPRRGGCVGQPEASSRARKEKAEPWRACRQLPAQADRAVPVLCKANPVPKPRDTDKQQPVKDAVRGGCPAQVFLNFKGPKSKGKSKKQEGIQLYCTAKDSIFLISYLISSKKKPSESLLTVTFFQVLSSPCTSINKWLIYK